MPDTTLIEALQNPALYDHPVKSFKLLETHISWVILTGVYAYKIKNPVDFGFLNYTELSARKDFCQKELQLNQAFSQSLYVDVIAITGSCHKPVLNGKGPAIEYALKMHEFDQQQLFSEKVKHDALTHDLIEDVAEQIATFHLQTPVCQHPDYGSADMVYAPVAENFEQITPLLKSSNADVTAHAAWAASTFEQLKTTLAMRKQKGFIRECHGDLHCGNITRYQDQTIIFDRIEFNEPFRFTDVMADVSFFYMDLLDKQQPALASHFLNTYIKRTGDYTGLVLLPFYAAYRAMVRAKVALLEQKPEIFDRYIALARTFEKSSTPALIITHGFSGCGKTTYANTLINHLPVIHLQSDLERKRLYNRPLQKSDTDDPQLYSEAATEKTYQHLADLTQLLLTHGYQVLVDATFLKQAMRDRFADIAKQLRCSLTIIDFVVADENLQANIMARQAHTISDATVEVLVRQQQTADPLTTFEQTCTLTVGDTAAIDWPHHLQTLRQHIATITVFDNNPSDVTH